MRKENKILLNITKARREREWKERRVLKAQKSSKRTCP